MRKNITFFLLFLFHGFYTNAQNINGTIRVNNVPRDYIIHLPSGYKTSIPLPLVLIFHGGGGNSAQMQPYMDMDKIADRENFITVYPNGINKQWNDGREFKEAITANDDVAFISQLLDTLGKKYAIDTKKIFSTGISNGGFFSIYLSYKLSHRLLGVAPVCATIPEKIYKDFYPEEPISILLMNGTKDPLVPYMGGDVGNKLTGSRGACVSTAKTIDRYISVDHTSAESIDEEIPDKNIFDGCLAGKHTYSGGRNNTVVCLIEIINGGHTLPGGSQYLPKMIVGKVCKDFDGNEMIWQFFHSLKPRQ